MESFKAYIMSVCAAAIISACANALLKSKSNAKLIRLICCIFVMITVIKPIASVKFPDLEKIISARSYDSSDHISAGISQAAALQKEVILQRVEEYILDKAEQLECDLVVSVFLRDEAPYEPVGVKIQGEISPYAKSILSSSLYQDLGIAREDQQWIGAN